MLTFVPLKPQRQHRDHCHGWRRMVEWNPVARALPSLLPSASSCPRSRRALFAQGNRASHCRPINPLPVPHNDHDLPRRHQRRQEIFKGLGRNSKNLAEIIARYARRAGSGDQQRQRRHVGDFSRFQPFVEGCSPHGVFMVSRRVLRAGTKSLTGCESTRRATANDGSCALLMRQQDALRRLPSSSPSGGEQA